MYAGILICFFDSQISSISVIMLIRTIVIIVAPMFNGEMDYSQIY